MKCLLLFALLALAVYELDQGMAESVPSAIYFKAYISVRTIAAIVAL